MFYPFPQSFLSLGMVLFPVPISISLILLNYTSPTPNVRVTFWLQIHWSVGFRFLNPHNNQMGSGPQNPYSDHFLSYAPYFLFVGKLAYSVNHSIIRLPWMKPASRRGWQSLLFAPPQTFCHSFTSDCLLSWTEAWLWSHNSYQQLLDFSSLYWFPCLQGHPSLLPCQYWNHIGELLIFLGLWLVKNLPPKSCLPITSGHW